MSNKFIINWIKSLFLTMLLTALCYVINNFISIGDFLIGWISSLFFVKDFENRLNASN